MLINFAKKTMIDVWHGPYYLPVPNCKLESWWNLSKSLKEMGLFQVKLLNKRELNKMNWVVNVVKKWNLTSPFFLGMGEYATEKRRYFKLSMEIAISRE